MFILLSRSLTADEVMSIVRSEIEGDPFDKIYLYPPAVNVDSDEDSPGEDETGMAYNMPSSKLHAVGCYVNGELIGQEEETDSAKKVQINSWDDKDLDYEHHSFPDANYAHYYNKSPLELFELFFIDEIFTILQTESARYALSLKEPDPKITKKELKVFIGILILSGYNKYPSDYMYWDFCDHPGVKIVVETMARDRYMQIKRFLHFADNCNASGSDKMWKLRPLMNILQSQFSNHFQPEQNLCFNESTIVHGCMQFVRRIPVEFGFKIWCINAKDGYLVNFDLHQGRNECAYVKYASKLNQFAAKLAVMIDQLPEDKKNYPYYFYFDDRVTSFKLLNHLRENGYRGAGIIQDDCFEGSCTLSSTKHFRSKPKGTMEHTRSVEDDVILVRWLDKKVQTIASNSYGVNPTINVSRYSRITKNSTNFPQPAVFSKHDEYIGGTTQMSKSIEKYRISIRYKKWWWPIFTWCIDSAVHNAWILNQKGKRPATPLDFRRSIVKAILTKSGDTYCSPYGVSDNIRLDNLSHFPGFMTKNKRKRCSRQNCTSKVNSMCIKCEVALCIKCFKPFHTQP